MALLLMHVEKPSSRCLNESMCASLLLLVARLAFLERPRDSLHTLQGPSCGLSSNRDMLKGAPSTRKSLGTS